MSQHYSLSEFLRVVLKDLAMRRGDLGSVALPEDPSALHRAFYGIPNSLKKRFSVLSDLHFITAGAFPYSPELTEALDALQMSGAIARENPSFERFTPKRHTDTDTVIPAAKKKITGKSQEQIKAMSRIVEHLNRELPTV